MSPLRPAAWAPAYLERLLFLLVHRAQAAEGRDELVGDQRPVRLLPHPALGQHAFHHLHYVSLREAVGDLRQAAHVQGVRHDSAVALDDLLPQDCWSETVGKAQTARSALGGRYSPGARHGVAWHRAGGARGARSELSVVQMGRSRGTKRFPEWVLTASRTYGAPASTPRVPCE